MGILAALSSGWTWLFNNKWALYVAGAVAAFLGYLAWKESIVSGVRRQERDAAKRRSAEAETRIINTITENSNELVRESERVRARDATVELPDGTRDLPEYHYRD